MVFGAHALNPDGTWQRRELPGPPSFETYWASWRSGRRCSFCAPPMRGSWTTTRRWCVTSTSATRRRCGSCPTPPKCGRGRCGSSCFDALPRTSTRRSRGRRIVELLARQAVKPRVHRRGRGQGLARELHGAGRPLPREDPDRRCDHRRRRWARRDSTRQGRRAQGGGRGPLGPPGKGGKRAGQAPVWATGRCVKNRRNIKDQGLRGVQPESVRLAHIDMPARRDAPCWPCQGAHSRSFAV